MDLVKKNIDSVQKDKKADKEKPEEGKKKTKE